MASLRADTEYDPTSLVKINIEIELLNASFFKYLDEIDVDVRFNGELFLANCRFKKVPDEDREKINVLVQSIVKKSNESLREERLQREKEKEEYLQKQREEEEKEKEYLERQRAETEKEREREKEKLKSETYDIVVLIQSHGCASTTTLKTLKVCNVIPIEKKKYVSFLEAVPCGVINYCDESWHKETREEYDRYRKIWDDPLPPKDLVLQLQRVFREQKQKELKDKKGSLRLGITRDLKLDARTAEEARAYMRIPGWNLYTSNKNFLDRHYGLEKKWPFAFVVIDCKDKSLIGTQLNRFLPSLDREELIKYLHSQGFEHPLIIDNSCAGVNSPSERDSRTAARCASEFRGSGKRTRRTKRKRRSMKRPKIKKFIYFP